VMMLFKNLGLYLAGNSSFRSILATMKCEKYGMQ
jgi:hypothetical protein